MCVHKIVPLHIAETKVSTKLGQIQIQPKAKACAPWPFCLYAASARLLTELGFKSYSAIMCTWTISRKDGSAFKTSYAYKQQASRNRAFQADALFSVSEAKPKRKWTNSLAKLKKNSAQSEKMGGAHPSSLFALFCLVLECHYFLDATCMTTATKIS